MSDIENSTPTARHWRDIPQEIAPRAMSSVGRRRLTLRTCRNLGLVVLAMLAVFGGFRFWETMEKLKALGASSILVLPIEKMME